MAQIVCNWTHHKTMTLLRSIPAVGILLLGSLGAVAADNAERSCPLPPARPLVRTPPPPDAPTYITAEQLRSLRGGVTEFTGQVELQRGETRLTAEALRHDEATGVVEATGNLALDQAGGDHFETTQLRMRLDTHEGETGPASYRIVRGAPAAAPQPPIPPAQQRRARAAVVRGDASKIVFDGPDRTLLSEVRLTSCEPGQDDWFLKAREIELDTAEDLATVRGVTLTFYDVPILYLPYLSFSISEQRKSGFLLPHVGYKTKLGLFVSEPYYFNLAPNYDATLTPRVMTQRGLMLSGEYRYLGPSSTAYVTADALPGDRLDGEDRYAATVRYQNTLTPLWSANVDLRGVSDKIFLDDFGPTARIATETHLPQSAELGYRGALWRFDARLAGYQTVDRTIPLPERPYQRLPQLALSAAPSAGPNKPRWQLDAEAAYFTRDSSLTGSRLNVTPAVSLPLSTSYGFLTPKAGARHIAYSLSEETASGSGTAPSVTSGFFSLDSGLFFDRNASWGTQTLEPRVYYLHVPRRDQSTLPNFDTGIADFSFVSLFRDNRFVGGDRIGDTRQLTAAVTTRFLDRDSGAERLRLSLGEIYYLRDREVSLGAGSDSTATSDLAAEAVAWLANNWHASLGVQYDEAADELKKGGLYVQYHPAPNRIINAGWRFIRDQVGQTDVSLEWPAGGRWTYRARWIFSSREDRNVDSYGGLEYNACCWALRVFATRRYSDLRGQVNGIEFQLELGGISRLGHVPESPLSQGLFSFPSAPR